MLRSQEQARRGFTFMLPTEDTLWVGEELARRFGLPVWQFALTATDANRFAIRLARHITGRRYVLVFNWCYHGTVDESFAMLREGRTVARAGNIGPPVDPAVTTRVVEFNDLPALEKALATHDVACVLAEPAMTNIGIVLPDAGFHAALRDLTRRTGTLLVIDETHTISAGTRRVYRGTWVTPGHAHDRQGRGRRRSRGSVRIHNGGSGADRRVDTDGYDRHRRNRRDPRRKRVGDGCHACHAGKRPHEESFRRTIPLATRFADGVREAIVEHISRGPFSSSDAVRSIGSARSPHETVRRRPRRPTRTSSGSCTSPLSTVGSC